MKVFAKVGENFQIVDETDSECPDGYIEMQGARPDGENTLDYTAQADGTWAVTQETLNAKLAIVENAWREEQMKRVANQLLMLEDDDPDAEPGTARQWRDYRIELRKWNEVSPEFPNSSKRPVAPT